MDTILGTASSFMAANQLQRALCVLREPESPNEFGTKEIRRPELSDAD